MSEHMTLEREEELMDLVLGDLDEAKRAQVAAHVEACTEGCKEFVAEHRDLPERFEQWAADSTPSPELEARKDEMIAEMRRAVAQVKAVRRVEAETAAAKAAKDADVIPIERARWRRTRMLMRTSWAATAAAAAAAVAMWLHGGPAPVLAPVPVVAQTRPDDAGERAMASVGEQPTDSLSRAQVTAVYHVYDEYVQRALDDYDAMREKIRAVGVPADKVDAVTRQMAKTIELTVRLQRIAPVKL